MPNSLSVLNIFFTLALGLFSIIIYNYFLALKNEKLQYKIFGIEVKKIIGILFVLLIAYIGSLLRVDYGFFGIIVIFAFYLYTFYL